MRSVPRYSPFAVTGAEDCSHAPMVMYAHDPSSRYQQLLPVLAAMATPVTVVLLLDTPSTYTDTTPGEPPLNTTATWCHTPLVGW